MKRALTLAVLLTLAMPIAANQATAKKGVKTPVVKKKLKRAIPTKTATTLPGSPTTVPTSTVPAGVVDPQSQEAVLAAYQRFEDIRYAVYVDKTKATIELPKVAAELTLAAELRVAKSMAGTTWTAKREEWRSLDTRIIEFNPPTAVVRACITGSMAPVLVLATGLQIPDQVSFSSDSAVNMRYVKGKGWLVTSIDWFDDSFGDSKCAVGR
jgi:hypothetical protein